MSQVARGHRKQRVGTVVSDKMDKTVVVRVDRLYSHPLYRKVVKQSKKYHVHDEQNTATTGDRVRIQETRPYSRTKRWFLVDVIEKKG